MPCSEGSQTTKLFCEFNNNTTFKSSRQLKLNDSCLYSAREICEFSGVIQEADAIQAISQSMTQHVRQLLVQQEDIQKQAQDKVTQTLQQEVEQFKSQKVRNIAILSIHIDLCHVSHHTREA